MAAPWTNLLDAVTPASPADSPSSAAQLAAALAARAAPGHFDELRGRVSDEATGSGAANQELTPAWSQFFDQSGLGDLTGLAVGMAHLQPRMHESIDTANDKAGARAGGVQPPWSLDLFPLIITPASWRQIEAGVLQRVHVLEGVMADVYGAQRLVTDGLLPPALVQGHPGYLRAMHGALPTGGMHLPIVAFDLARGPDGNWRVLSQHTQAPAGLGQLLANRRSIEGRFAQAFETLHVQRLAASYSALLRGLVGMTSAGTRAHIALLTPGADSESYPEHAYLARSLGLSLVEGNDLTVRNQRLYLRTLRGPERVHVLWKQLDDEFLDPLELRADSRPGVPGLLQAIRAGHVRVANAPGSAFLESPALSEFLPALSQHMLGEALALDGWATRMRRDGDPYTVPENLLFSQLPTCARQHESAPIVPRPATLRVFAVCDGPQSWRVLPGGLTRIAAADAGATALQRGAGSADTWVLTQGPGDVDRAALWPRAKPLVTSRAAENLYWLGRYTERCKGAIRLARLTLGCLHTKPAPSPQMLAWLGDLAARNVLVPPGAPPASLAPREFERALIAGLAGGATAGVGFCLRAARLAAFAVRERLSEQHWNLIVQAGQAFAQPGAEGAQRTAPAAPDAMRALDSLSAQLATLAGAQNDLMRRDDGEQLLAIGRSLERLGFLAASLTLGFETGAVHEAAGFNAMLALFDSVGLLPLRQPDDDDVAILIGALVLDSENPHALGRVAQTLAQCLGKLSGGDPGKVRDIARQVPEPQGWSLQQLSGVDGAGQHYWLMQLLEQCTNAAGIVSNDIGAVWSTPSMAPDAAAKA